MPPKTPVRLAEKVLKLWVAGLPRDEIGRKAGTSVGNILNIVKESKKNTPDINLLRQVAVWIKKYGWNQEVFSGAVRQRNILYSKGLIDEQIDDLIELLDEHCYKREISIGKFLSSLGEMSMYSKKYNCRIDQLDELMTEKEMATAKWEVERASLEISYNEMLQRYDATKNELIQYRKDQPLLEKIIELKKENQELRDYKHLVNLKEGEKVVNAAVRSLERKKRAAKK